MLSVSWVASMYTLFIRYCCGCSVRTKQGASGALSVMGVLLEQYSTSGTVGVLLEQFMLCTATDVLLEQTVHIRYWPVCTPHLSGTAVGFLLEQTGCIRCRQCHGCFFFLTV